MELPSLLRLTRCSTGREEVARIARLDREEAKRLIDETWWAELGSTLSDPALEPDHHWNWTKLVSVYRNKPYFRAVCVKTTDEAVQAAMLFRVDALSALAAAQKAVFVDRLATAPRNRDTLVDNPAFRGAGSGLLTYAVAVSYSLGFSGTVNLFPIAHEEFYLDLGFQRTEIIEDDERLFELPATAGLQLLQQRGLTNG
jgi:hypothetical protein